MLRVHNSAYAGIPKGIRVMTHDNPTFRPDFFPVEVTDLVDRAYAVSGVDALLDEMGDKHEATVAHMRSVALLASAEVVACGESSAIFDQEYSMRVVLGGLLHDMGKAHPDITPLIDVVGDYTDDQRAIMGRHTTYGAELTSHYSEIRGSGLVPDIIYLHHATHPQIEAYIQKRGYNTGYALQLRAAATIVSIADVVEATLPIGDENSHHTFGDRELPLEVVDELIYGPLSDKLPDIPQKITAFRAAKAVARQRVQERHLVSTVSF